MNIEKDKMDKMLYHAYKSLLFNEMLIDQCDNWLPAEEGNRNMEADILKTKEKFNNKKRKV